MLVLRPAGARISDERRNILERYLTALQQQRYAAAFALLTDSERAYFGSASNFASGYAADRFSLGSYRIVASQPRVPTVLVYVLERVAFFDYAHRTRVALDAKVAYGLEGSPGKTRIKDPHHPWYAVAPERVAALTHNVRVSVDKLAFFTGRLEVVATFANFGDSVVTLLPYGRSIVRDAAGHAYLPIQSRLASLTDRTLFTGLRLAANGQYTGSMSFLTPNRFSPKVLSFRFGPALRDGDDAPFQIEIPAHALARRR